MVVDIRGGDVAGWRVEYVSRLTHPGSGATVTTRGGARLQVTVNHPAYDSSGRSTYLPGNRDEMRDVTGYRTLRQLRWLGSYEGYSDFGIGVRARLPFRVFELDGPGSGSRLVIDVAHRW